ncbi:MAG: efflux RND transporter periplasmic adaptor subunit [Lachnospiraceae bacterium]|nr:efflux RND transporter periplasmic adaptor subunit [Lachnospiraceae bacterium]
MKIRGNKSLTLLAIFALCLSGCSLIPTEHLREPELFTGEDVPEYEFATVKKGNLIKEENVVCTYMSIDSQELSFDIAGEKYGGIYVQAGDEVKKGDLVAELDTAAEKQILEDLLSEKEHAEYMLSLLKEKRALTAERARLLYEAADVGEKIKRDTPEEVWNSFEPDIILLEDRIEELSNSVTAYEQRIEDCRLYADMDGTVTYVKEINSKSTSIAGARVVVISDLSTSLFKSYTTHKPLFTTGSRFTAEIDGRNYPVEVAEPDEFGIAAKENEVFFKIIGSAYGLTDGSKGTVKVVTESATNVLYVDSKAVNSYGDQMIVFYLDENNVRNYKTVKIGVTINGFTEISFGAHEGEEFIIG